MLDECSKDSTEYLNDEDDDTEDTGRGGSRGTVVMVDGDWSPEGRCGYHSQLR